MDPDTFRVYFAEKGEDYVHADGIFSLFRHLWYSYDSEDVSTLDPSETMSGAEEETPPQEATVSHAAPPTAQQNPLKARKESERQNPTRPIE